jgi:hypothetical protein
MGNWTFHHLPADFVRYVYDGCVELGRRMATEPDLQRQIEDVIREQLSRTPIEALEIEQGLTVLTGPAIAQAVMGCLRYLETYEEVEDLRQAGFEEAVVQFIRYLVSRYGPVFKAIRRRHNHPLGWHKFGHAIMTMETGAKHIHVKLVRNDDTVIHLEDDAESMLRLVNFFLKAIESAGDYDSLHPATVQELTERYHRLLEATSKSGAGRNPRTEH